MRSSPSPKLAPGPYVDHRGAQEPERRIGPADAKVVQEAHHGAAVRAPGVDGVAPVDPGLEHAGDGAVEGLDPLADGVSVVIRENSWEA